MSGFLGFGDVFKANPGIMGAALIGSIKHLSLTTEKPDEKPSEGEAVVDGKSPSSLTVVQPSKGGPEAEESGKLPHLVQTGYMPEQ